VARLARDSSPEKLAVLVLSRSVVSPGSESSIRRGTSICQREKERSGRRGGDRSVRRFRDTRIAVSRIGAFVFDGESLMIVSRASLGKIKLPDMRAWK